MNPRSIRQLGAALVLVALAAAGCVPAPAPVAAGAPGGPAYVRMLHADETALWLGQNYQGLVLDVRNPDEWDDALGHIDSARPIPLGELEARLPEIAAFRDKPVLVYCKDGTRAPAAAQVLVRNGFTDVSWLDGGLAAYRRYQAGP